MARGGKQRLAYFRRAAAQYRDDPQPVVAEPWPAATQQESDYRIGKKMLELVRMLEAHHRHIDGWPQATNPYQHNHGDGKDAPVGSREVFEKKHQVSFPFRVYASVTTPADGRQCLRKLQRPSSPDGRASSALVAAQCLYRALQ